MPEKKLEWKSSYSSPEKWNENEDDFVTAWKMCRSAIEHENELVNHRLTWLFSSQGFLFAAFALVFQSSFKNDVNDGSQEFFQIVLSGITIVGILICLIIALRVHAAMKQHDDVKSWWNDCFADDNKKANYPPICGEEKGFLKILRIPLLPVVFIFAWIAFFCVTNFKFIRENATSIAPYMTYIIIGFASLVLGILLTKYWSYITKP